MHPVSVHFVFHAHNFRHAMLPCNRMEPVLNELDSSPKSHIPRNLHVVGVASGLPYCSSTPCGMPHVGAPKQLWVQTLIQSFPGSLFLSMLVFQIPSNSPRLKFSPRMLPGYASSGSTNRPRWPAKPAKTKRRLNRMFSTKMREGILHKTVHHGRISLRQAPKNGHFVLNAVYDLLCSSMKN